MATEYLGIDVGGTNVKMGIVNAENGNITNFYSHDTVSWRQNNRFVESLGDAIAVMLNENPEVQKTGIGVPGLITRDRTPLLEISAIPEIDGTSLISLSTKKIPG